MPRANPKVAVVRKVRNQIRQGTEAESDVILELTLCICYPTKESQNS